MAVSLSLLAGAGWQFFDDNGNPLSGGLLYTYEAGTTTPLATYTDSNGNVANANPIVLDAAGRVPYQVWLNPAYSYKFILKTSLLLTVWTEDNVPGYGSSADILFLQAGTGAVARTVQSKMRDVVSAFDYMTTAEITAVQSYAYALDMTATLQNAINQAFALQADLFIPAGGYSVTGLYLPGRVSGGTDDRGKAIRVYGQGTGEPYVVSNPKGTVIKSNTNAPVLQDYLDTDPSSNGTVEVDHIRFVGNSSTPVVLLQSFYGESSFHHNVIYQLGTGDGLKLTYAAGVWVYMCFALNRDWNTYSLGASRVGIGFNFPLTYNSGLVAFHKCSARGFLTGFSIGGGAGTEYSPTITESECSVVYNGIILSGTSTAYLRGNYIEGGDGGIGIKDDGDYTTITNCLIFAGFAKAIDATNTSSKGTLIEGNAIGLGAVANAIGIDVTSSAAFGGYNKNVIGNSLSYTPGTNGVNGIKISGTDPRVTMLGNSFDPRGNWTGTSTKKINDASSNGSYGIVQAQLGDLEIPVLSRGAITVEQGPTALTQANVSGNILTIPDAGSYFVCNATSACTVQQIAAGVTPGRIVVFKTDTANMTFQDTAFVFLNGNFTGPGTLTLLIDRIGASNYAYEIARTVF